MKFLIFTNTEYMNYKKRNSLAKIAFAILFSIISMASVLATNYYVDANNGNNSNNGLQSTAAKQTIQAAANLTNPGDTVFVMNGTYGYTTYNNMTLLNITRSGTEGNYITYKPLKGHSPKIQLSTTVTSQVWNAVVVDASYIVVEGFEIEGNNASLTYAEGYQTWQDYENGIKDWLKISKYNANGISLGKNVQAHHVVIRNCKIHDCASGVGGGKVDYITIENNTIYNNCWYTMYATSGISFLDPISIDNVTSHKIFIRNNVVYNNKTLVPWEKINALSDGNGIILDVNNGSTGGSVYVGRTLVANNVVYNNGGGGVHAYRASHIDIINNTAYNNGTVVGYPEIDANNCSDVKIYNNIMYARTGGNANGNDAGAIYDYNLYFNSNAGPYKQGPHDMIGNPQFTTLATDASANFRLNNNSPAINNGSNVAGQFTTSDMLGVARPIGFLPDMGAYEYATVIPRAEINVKQGSTDIVDNTGAFDFGDVSSTAPKSVTFTIQNLGDLALNLTGTTPKVVVTGTGFSLETDAPATVSAAGSVTFQVKLTPTTVGSYSGTVSIANDDATENPYNFAITGYGYDGTKALQTLTFDALPIKVIGTADFDPGATSSASLPVAYASSNTGVATILNGKIHIVAAGTSTITASQAGNTNTNGAKSVTQLLTVTPVLPAPGTNMITNPTFDTNLVGWTFSNKNSATATVESVVKTGFSGNAIKLTTTAIGTNDGMDNVQYSTNVFVVKDKNYLIQFKASADAARNTSVNLLMNSSPWSTIFSKSVALTTTPTAFGAYSFTSTYTGSVAFRIFAGNNTTPVYIDDVLIAEDVFPIGTSIQESKANRQAEVNVYPNPVTDLLKVDLDANIGQYVTIKVIDLQGRVWLAKNQFAIIDGKNTVELNVGSLANGIYFVKTIANNITFKAAKVVVKH